MLTRCRSRKRNGNNKVQTSVLCFGDEGTQTVPLEYKLLGFLGKSKGEGNPQGDTAYFLICRSIIGFNSNLWAWGGGGGEFTPLSIIK